MTDDFRLFADNDDGDHPIDADIALITAYLARELSPMQVLAVEERLVSDPEFREAMQPLIDAWAAPVSSLSGAARQAAPLSAREKTESWRRFEQAEPANQSVTVNTNRKVSMKRVAAIVGLTALPVFSFAQAVSYAARHENAPGHVLASQMIAVFTTAPAAVKPALTADRPTPKVDDAPLGKILTPTPAFVQERAAPIVEMLSIPANPDRERVVTLVKQHQPRVVSGDTIVEYVVMVVDASDKYLWSTFGSGNLQIEVGADPRTPRERSADNLQFQKELIGYDTRTETRRILVVDSLQQPTRKPPYAIARIVDSIGTLQPLPSTSGAAVATRKIMDSVLITDAATAQGVRATPVGDSGRVRYEYVGPYRAGWVFTVAGKAPLNAASGLQEPGNGESGIQGIRSASVTRADTYQFPEKSLAPKSLRVVVVRLAPGTTWRRSF
jgi:anti-sigma-K factor RskA